MSQIDPPNINKSTKLNSNISYTYIPPEDQNCNYVNQIFINLWIEPIEIALFAMLKTFSHLNISCVLYGGTLLSYLRHTRVLPWDKDGDLAFQLPSKYVLKLDKFLYNIFIPKLNELYPLQKFKCIINTDAIYSLFNCRLINKPGYVDAFAEYTFYSKKLYDKFQDFIQKINSFQLNEEQKSVEIEKLRNEILMIEKDIKIKNTEPFIWNQHYLDTWIHLKPISILFPQKYSFWNRLYVDKYNITKIEVPANEINVARIFYGDNYLIPPDFTRNEKYGICDRQKHKIELFCFGNHQTKKYDRGGDTVNVTEYEISLCHQFGQVFGIEDQDHDLQYNNYNEYFEYQQNDIQTNYKFFFFFWSIYKFLHIFI